MSIYADTSFLISLYLTDQHSKIAERRVSESPSLWLTPLHVVEWAHAVEQHVFWKKVSRSEADRYHRAFQEHREAGVWAEVALPESAFDLCTELARRYAARLGVRTLDTLHVASALELKAEGFWTFDERQKRLARATGLKTS